MYTHITTCTPTHNARCANHTCPYLEHLSNWSCPGPHELCACPNKYSSTDCCAHTTVSHIRQTTWRLTTIRNTVHNNCACAHTHTHTHTYEPPHAWHNARVVSCDAGHTRKPTILHQMPNPPTWKLVFQHTLHVWSDTKGASFLIKGHFHCFS